MICPICQNGPWGDDPCEPCMEQYGCTACDGTGVLFIYVDKEHPREAMPCSRCAGEGWVA